MLMRHVKLSRSYKRLNNVTRIIARFPEKLFSRVLKLSRFFVTYLYLKKKIKDFFEC